MRRNKFKFSRDFDTYFGAAFIVVTITLIIFN